MGSVAVFACVTRTRAGRRCRAKSNFVVTQEATGKAARTHVRAAKGQPESAGTGRPSRVRLSPVAKDAESPAFVAASRRSYGVGTLPATVSFQEEKGARRRIR